ncbi:thiaminase II [Lutispora thermophila]|uniref:Aminopyrimidine aminohydrolase n=1 Tax=Lutispora thermophila DSM 19022 TaxID=1122184 RepID=A0A1M6EIA0_9FIRM|nr:thiaminase II [Lutispora thermophila]SHI85149.1 thiaminase (transcriptional activator TenA) [Lutispora thermophila DSM 19022]
MTFMEETLAQVLPIWDRCVEAPFVQEVKKGTLPMEKFKHYMIQDSIYLKYYARVYGKAIYHSSTLKDIQMFYSALCFVTDTESAVRLSYLNRFGLTDSDIEDIEPFPENKNYIDFMMDIADNGDICEMLMAVLPCMLSYNYIFRKIAAEPESKGSIYRDFIEDYANERYVASCRLWSDFADEKCAALSDDRKKKLAAIFEKASLLELDFWNMSYKE